MPNFDKLTKLLFSTNNLPGQTFSQLMDAARQLGVQAFELNERYDQASWGETSRKIQRLREEFFFVPAVNVLLDWKSLEEVDLPDEVLRGLEALSLAGARVLNLYVLPDTCPHDAEPRVLVSFLAKLAENVRDLECELKIENVASTSAPIFLKDPRVLSSLLQTSGENELGVTLDPANYLMCGIELDDNECTQLLRVAIP